MDRDGARRLAARTLAVIREKNVTVTAASLAYYAFNSLVPLTLLLFVLVTTYGRVEALLPTFELLVGVDLSQFEPTLRAVSGNSAGRVRAAALALGIFLWSSLRLFRGMDSVFSEVYGTRKEVSALRRFLNSVLVMATVAVGVGVIAAAGLVVSFRVTQLLWSVVAPVLLWALLTVLFVPMYALFPGVDVSPLEPVPGAALAALGWTASLQALRLYFGVSQSIELYGAAGGVLLILTWLYVGSLALLVGVVVNAVLANRVDADADWYPGDEAAGDETTGDERG
ncbi:MULTISPECIES: YihY/virulence factor BrkB family protein [Haloferax]|uniref:Ribonuclease BN n=1 Tax=Haloferax gibbonsii TaxID=35746 RepID=A0A0K1IQU0_HALGI|nr:MULTISPECIES: YihY/virulence factor BrkB family protein [Haloferax]AKU06685.1 ribonuclease BN [Haloferax gibbonsii]RDZ54521.1 YihY/virulence factor BrkB family protein [Haloferax sp. Atlit-4N]REA05837.1 YihY/virulence factor BrkB family protein [Haloferax sp. Atlit-6N]